MKTEHRHDHYAHITLHVAKQHRVVNSLTQFARPNANQTTPRLKVEDASDQR